MSNIAMLLPVWILGLPLLGALVETIRAWGDKTTTHAVATSSRVAHQV